VGDFTEAVARYSEAVHTARGHGGNFHIGVAKRFAKWGEANGWSPDSVPADALETWTSSSLAQGKQHRAVEKERVLLGDFLGFLQTGDLGVAQPQGGNGISVSTEIPDEVPADEAPAGDTSGIPPDLSGVWLPAAASGGDPDTWLPPSFSTNINPPIFFWVSFYALP